MSTAQIIITYAIFLVIILSLMLLYTKMLQKTREYARNKKSSELLYNASVTDDGVPANEIFKTLYESGVEIDYLVEKDKE